MIKRATILLLLLFNLTVFSQVDQNDIFNKYGPFGTKTYTSLTEALKEVDKVYKGI